MRYPKSDIGMRFSLQLVHHRSILLPILRLMPSMEEFFCEDFSRIFLGGQWYKMAKKYCRKFQPTDPAHERYRRQTDFPICYVRIIKLFWNNSEIISVFYFPRNYVWNWNQIISAAERVLKSFRNEFGDIERVAKCSRATISLRETSLILK